MMYEELVKDLRGMNAHIVCESCVRSCCGQGDLDIGKCLLLEAADAIEELSKKRVGTWHRIKATQRSYSFVCNSCGFMYPYLTRCCPYCGVEYIDEEPPKEGEHGKNS